MSEAKLWKKLKAAADKIGGIRMSRHECSITKGTPDVSFSTPKVNGWIELKYIPKAPVRPNAKPLAGKLSIEQIRFLKSRPNTFVLVEIGGKDGGFWMLLGEDAPLLDLLSWSILREDSPQTLTAIITETVNYLHVKM